MMASLCDVAAIPLATPKYHEAVKRGFMRAAQRVDLGHIIDETIQSAGVDAGSDAARDAMFAAISAVKGGPIG